MRQRIESLEQFRALQAEYMAAREAEKRKILVCCGTGCVAGGNLNVYHELKKRMDELGIPCEVSLTEHHDDSVGLKKSGCHGFCEMGPLVRIEPEGWLYTKCQVSDVEEIIQKTILGGQFIERLGYNRGGELYERQEDIPFYKRQTRRVLEHCGHIDAESIEEYLSIGGYGALAKALFEMQPDEIVQVVSDSGLRGRGGAGFPTGKKWAQVAAHTEEPVKYIVCNGDEGDPGAFMDRSCMEGDPHKVIEGMIVAGVATGSTEGYIYVRAEYPMAVHRLTVAIEQAKKLGLLGDNILGSGFNFHMHINCGAGAFVCGEGSAMTASIEGNRGMPRTKPPRSVDKGLYGKPTCLNNVETFANVPDIIKKGADWFKSVGTEGSSGTKAFGFKGGIGTSSRKLPASMGGYTVGVLVQTNFGGFLNVDGVAVGEKLGGYPWQKEIECADGSIMMVVATDAPIDARNLERVAKRAFMGLAKAGGIASNGSGDFAIAFSTAKENRVPHNTKKLEKLQNVNVANDDMTPIFMATIEATEEAVVNSLFKAKDVKGYNGKVTKALPVDQVLEMLKAEGKIVKQPR